MHLALETGGFSGQGIGEQNSDNFRKRASEGKGLAGAKPQR